MDDFKKELDKKIFDFFKSRLKDTKVYVEFIGDDVLVEFRRDYESFRYRAIISNALSIGSYSSEQLDSEMQNVINQYRSTVLSRFFK